MLQQKHDDHSEYIQSSDTDSSDLADVSVSCFVEQKRKVKGEKKKNSRQREKQKSRAKTLDLILLSNVKVLGSKKLNYVSWKQKSI